MIPVAAIRPAERVDPIASFAQISGMSMTARVAVSAMADPDRLASNRPVPMTTYPKPPRKVTEQPQGDIDNAPRQARQHS